MLITIPVKNEIDFKTLRLVSNVRYYSSATVNGVDDNDDYPQIPGYNSDQNRLIWDIDINTGQILKWPKGVTAEVCYKTCDENDIFIYNSEDKLVFSEYSAYTPNCLALEDSGYGDYIILNINEDGYIHKWCDVGKCRFKEYIKSLSFDKIKEYIEYYE